MSELSRDPVRRALRALTHGVYVLGLRHDNVDDYLVVALAMQCSVEPPRVAFAVSNHARILTALRAQQGGVLSLLAFAEHAAVRRYGAPGGVRHLPDPVRRIDPAGHPVIPEASAWVAFRVTQELPAGDHVLFVADVVGGEGPTFDVAWQPMILASSGFPYAG